MANLSDAHGHLTVTADSKEAINELKKVCKWHDFGYDFSTEYLENIDELNVVEEKNYYVFNVTFYGCGRWVYQENIRNFLKWAYDDDNNEIDFDLLKRSTFTLKFSFIDYEPGMENLYEAEDSLFHIAGTEIKETRYVPSYFKKYKCNWVNLIKLEVMDLEDLIYNFLENSESNKEIYEILKKEKRTLEKYLKKSLKEIVGKEYYDSFLTGKREYEKHKQYISLPC